MKPFIVIVPGHGHRVKDLQWDPGACSGALQEAELVRTVARHLSALLSKAGRGHVVSDPLGLVDGQPHELRCYGRRCAFGLSEAKRKGYASAVILHMHFNAGSGRYGMVITDSRAPAEKKAAAPLVAALKRWGGAALSDVKNDDDAENPRARRLHDWSWEGSKGLWLEVSSFILEPAFVDQPQHAGLLGDSGLELLARYIAEGLA